MKAFRFGVVAAAQEGGTKWRDIAHRAEQGRVAGGSFTLRLPQIPA